jgi:hypothetical protein
MVYIAWRFRVTTLAAIVLAGVVQTPTVWAVSPSPQAPFQGLPAADNPALPHGLDTLRGLTGAQRAAPVVASNTQQGVDVASFQHPGGAAINWSQVASAGYRFAFVKATQGNYYTNPYFSSDYQASSALVYSALPTTLAIRGRAMGPARRTICSMRFALSQTAVPCHRLWTWKTYRGHRSVTG